MCKNTFHVENVLHNVHRNSTLISSVGTSHTNKYLNDPPIADCLVVCPCCRFCLCCGLDHDSDVVKIAAVIPISLLLLLLGLLWHIAALTMP